MEKIIEILNDIKPGFDYANETALIGNKVLESIEIMSLVVELSDAFDIEITALDIVPENFESVAAIYQMVLRLKDEE